MKTVEEVIDLTLQRWTKYLQLRDWGITVSVVDKKKMKKTVGVEVRGCVLYEIYEKSANIFILDSVGLTEIEEILVHELLHLCFYHEARFFNTISEYVGDDAVQELLSNQHKDIIERMLHQLTSALLKERK